MKEKEENFSLWFKAKCCDLSSTSYAYKTCIRTLSWSLISANKCTIEWPTFLSILLKYEKFFFLSFWTILCPVTQFQFILVFWCRYKNMFIRKKVVVYSFIEKFFFWPFFPSFFHLLAVYTVSFSSNIHYSAIFHRMRTKNRTRRLNS